MPLPLIPIAAMAGRAALPIAIRGARAMKDPIKNVIGKMKSRYMEGSMAGKAMKVGGDAFAASSAVDAVKETSKGNYGSAAMSAAGAMPMDKFGGGYKKIKSLIKK